MGDAGKRGGSLSVVAQTSIQQDPPDLWLIFAPIKKARTDFIVEKAAEMGARRILPVQTGFTNAERVNAMIEGCGVQVEPWIAEGTHAFDEPTSNGPMRHSPELTLEALNRFRRFLQDTAPSA